MAGTVDSELTAVIRCDASPTIGYGHLARSLALADALRSLHNVRVVFAISEDASAVSNVRARGYKVHPAPKPHTAGDNGNWLHRTVAEEGATALILDVRDDLPLEALLSMKAHGVLITTIDDPTDRRTISDLAFYPPAPQVLSMDWSAFTGARYVGWEWIIVRQDLLAYRRAAPAQDLAHKSVLVTMGGSDPAGMSLRVLSAIDTLSEALDTTLILGRGFMHNEALELFLGGARRQYRVARDPANFAELMAESHVVVASFGVTAYELAVLGVPAILLSLTHDHAMSAGALEDAGISVSLGVHTGVAPSQIAEAIHSLLSNDSRRQAMRKKAIATVDGQGAQRVAQVIKQRVRGGL